MKTLTSAGGVIVCSVLQRWYVLILKDMKGAWTFPKGIVEKRETRQSAALREIFEEVGLSRIKMLAPLTPVHYTFKRNGMFKKTVYYYLFISKIRTKAKPQKTEGVRDAKWVQLRHARDIIGYRETNIPLLEETWKFITHPTYSG